MSNSERAASSDTTVQRSTRNVVCIVFTAVYVQSKMSEKRLKRYSERDGDDDGRKRPAITGSDSDSFKSRTDEAAIAAQKKRAIQYIGTNRIAVKP